MSSWLHYYGQMSSEFSEKCLNKELLIKSTIITEGINDENRQFGTTVKIGQDRKTLIYTLGNY